MFSKQNFQEGFCLHTHTTYVIYVYRSLLLYIIILYQRNENEVILMKLYKNDEICKNLFKNISDL